MNAEDFLPKPGGLVDTHQKTHAQPQHEEELPIAMPENAYPAIRVMEEGPEVFTANVVTVSGNSSARILPYDKNRARAVISVDTASSKVVLSPSQGGAANGTGFTFAASDGILEVTSSGQLFAGNTTGSAIQVSVLAELYAPED